MPAAGGETIAIRSCWKREGSHSALCESCHIEKDALARTGPSEGSTSQTYLRAPCFSFSIGFLTSEIIIDI